jgi:hypothetical protein
MVDLAGVGARNVRAQYSVRKTTERKRKICCQHIVARFKISFSIKRKQMKGLLSMNKPDNEMELV